MSKRTVKVKILDEVNCVLIGLTPDHLLYFYEEYARFAPNYFFNPKFKLGSWDGKIRYFHKNGKTHTYLLNEIIPKLYGLHYNVELIDQRNSDLIFPDPVAEDHFAHILNPETDEPIKLRDYQVEMVNALTENGGGIAIAGTGAGKTLVNATLVDVYGQQGLKTITIVPNQDLIEQTRTEFLSWGLDTGEYSGDNKDINHTHVVSTWQALQNNKKIISEFQVVVVDECFDGDTMITMKDGSLKKIKYINPGDEIVSYNVDTQVFECDVVVKRYENMMKTSNEDMYELKFDDGTVINVTGNHQIMTTRGYVRADELTEDDEIIHKFNRSS